MIQLLATTYILAKYIPKPKLLMRKPLTCPLCLTYWSFLIYQLINFTTYFDLLTIPFTFALLASLIEQINDRYLL
jgi:hypothetical protein